MRDYLFSFERLNVWQASKILVKDVYQLISLFPNHEKFALSDQLRRVVVSIPSNIAEGTSRSSLKEQNHYIEIAYGSLMEVYCQIQIAFDLGYISYENVEMLKNQISSVAKQLNGLRTSFKNRQQ